MGPVASKFPTAYPAVRGWIPFRKRMAGLVGKTMAGKNIEKEMAEMEKNMMMFMI